MLRIEKDNCIGCGSCQATLPEVFGFDDDGLATVETQEIPSDKFDELADAIDSCPTAAIIQEKND